MLFEPRMKRLRMRVVTPGGVELDQHLANFGRRHHRQLLERCVGLLFQRLHQVLHGVEQVITNALRLQRRDHQRTEIELLAQVIDAEGDRVVGAFFGMQEVHAVPRLVECGGVVDHTTVTVIEQGTEQRRTRRHPAATLGQGQGRMLMTEQCGQARMGGLDGRAHTGSVNIDS
ncbi:hypothetical protein [Pseudomonas sp. 58 R 3]|nr:hypothetical protein [Pseudomonas sp. 58 R 3]